CLCVRGALGHIQEARGSNPLTSTRTPGRSPRPGVARPAHGTSATAAGGRCGSDWRRWAGLHERLSGVAVAEDAVGEPLSFVDHDSPDPSAGPPAAGGGTDAGEQAEVNTDAQEAVARA